MLARIRIPIPSNAGAGEIAIIVVALVAATFLRLWLKRNDARGGNATSYFLGGALAIGAAIAAYAGFVEYSAKAARYAVLGGGAALLASIIFAAAQLNGFAYGLSAIVGGIFLAKPVFSPVTFPFKYGYADGPHLAFVMSGAVLLATIAAIHLLTRTTLKLDRPVRFLGGTVLLAAAFAVLALSAVADFQSFPPLATYGIALVAGFIGIQLLSLDIPKYGLVFGIILAMTVIAHPFVLLQNSDPMSVVFAPIAGIALLLASGSVAAQSTRAA